MPESVVKKYDYYIHAGRLFQALRDAGVPIDMEINSIIQEQKPLHLCNQIIHCQDCANYDEEEWCSVWDIYLQPEFFCGCGKPKREAKKELGHWLRPEGSTPNSYRFVCSVCGGVSHVVNGNCRRGTKKVCDYKFCPRCGAEMETEDYQPEKGDQNGD